MGTEASKPLAPPDNWEQNNQDQLQIVSPTNNNDDDAGAVSNNFRIISPTSDISNSSDVWRLQHPMLVEVVPHNETSRRRSRNSSHNSSNRSFGKENVSNKQQSSGTGKRGVKKSHTRMGSLTKVFGCFVENPRSQEKPAEYGETSERRNLVEI